MDVRKNTHTPPPAHDADPRLSLPPTISERRSGRCHAHRLIASDEDPASERTSTLATRCRQRKPEPGPEGGGNGSHGRRAGGAGAASLGSTRHAPRCSRGPATQSSAGRGASHAHAPRPPLTAGPPGPLEAQVEMSYSLSCRADRPPHRHRSPSLSCPLTGLLRHPRKPGPPCSPPHAGTASVLGTSVQLGGPDGSFPREHTACTAGLAGAAMRSTHRPDPPPPPPPPPPQHRRLYALRGRGGEGRHFPALSRAGAAPCPLDPTIGGWAPKQGWLFESRLAGSPPPLTSLPPHVSRPGWYPAPLGSWSRQLRHQLKHGLDIQELTSHENKHLCIQTVPKRAVANRRRISLREPSMQRPRGTEPTGRGPPARMQGHSGHPSASDH